jgi:hypothetical protein
VIVAVTVLAVAIMKLFFDKEIVQQIVRVTNKYAEQDKNARGNFSHLDHL